MGDSSPLKDFYPSPPINICFHPPNKNVFPFPKNRLTYTHVTLDSRHMLPPFQLLYLYLLLLLSYLHPPCRRGREDFIGLFRLKGGYQFFFKLRVEPKFVLQNFEEGVVFSVLVEKLHTPETKNYHFSKKFACGGRLFCNFTHTMVTSGIKDHNFIIFM